LEISVWKRLWTCRETDKYLNLNITRNLGLFNWSKVPLVDHSLEPEKINSQGLNDVPKQFYSNRFFLPVYPWFHDSLIRHKKITLKPRTKGRHLRN
jgi:hypothetical protein